MTDPTDRLLPPDTLEDDLEALLRRRAEVDPASIERVRGSVTTLPPRRQRGRAGPVLLRAAAVITALVGVSVFALVNVPRGGGGAAPQAPDPKAFEHDPRLAECGVKALDEVLYVVPLERLDDYPKHFPAAFLLRGLILDPTDPTLLDDPALVVVYAGTVGASDRGEAPGELRPGEHPGCVVIGSGATSTHVGITVIDTTAFSASLPNDHVVTLDDGTLVARPLPPAAASWASDGRFQACAMDPSNVDLVFEMAHASDVARHFPNWTGGIEELQVDAPAFVVYGRGYLGTSGTPIGPGVTPEPEPTTLLVHDLCIVIDGVAHRYGPTSFQLIVPILDVPREPDPATDAPQPTGPSPVPPSIVPGQATLVPSESVPPPTPVIDTELACTTPSGAFTAFEGSAAPHVTESETVETFLAGADFTILPRHGWDRVGPGTFVYRVEDAIRAVMLLDDQGDRVAIHGRTCDPSEFDSADGITGPFWLWLGPDGRALHTTVAVSMPFNAHCYASGTVLQLGDRTFLADPDHLGGELTAGYDPDAALPADAEDTTFHHDAVHLWLARDGTAAYLVFADHVERWPRGEQLGCV